MATPNEKSKRNKSSNRVLNLKSKNVKRNSVKRRERSKISARSRRSRETEIFRELSSQLSIPTEFQTLLDKSSIIRLTICDLKLRNFLKRSFPSPIPPDVTNSFDSKITRAIHGFLFIINTSGRILYISPSVKCHLGLSQIDLMGQSLYDFAHPGDQHEVNELLHLNPNNSQPNPINSRMIRMKCTRTRRERNYNLRLYTYKGINCSGRVLNGSGGTGTGSGGSGDLQKWIIGIGEPLFCPSDPGIHNRPFKKQAFYTRHNHQMVTTHADDRIGSFLGYSPDELIGISFFEFYHALDWDKTLKTIYSTMAKGQGRTEMYRFLAKGGGWVWVQTQICAHNPVLNCSNLGNSNGRNNDIICLHYVLSQIECPGEVLSEVQINPKKFQKPSSIPSLKPIPLAHNILPQNNEFLKDLANSQNIPINQSTTTTIDLKKNYINGLLTYESSDEDKIPFLNQLTREDCEVNAPLKGNTSLLQGVDLLQALDVGGS